MSGTGAGGSSRTRGAVFRNSGPARESLNFHPQNCGSSLNSVRVCSITPRNALIPLEFRYPGSQRDPVVSCVDLCSGDDEHWAVTEVVVSPACLGVCL